MQPQQRTPQVEEKRLLKQMVSHYLSSNPIMRQDNKINEVEVRFGTMKNGTKITKIDYDNTVSQLYSAGFTLQNMDGLHLLRIQSEQEITDCSSPAGEDAAVGAAARKTKKSVFSDIRTEIEGIDLIQEYCKTNSLQKILDLNSSITANNFKIKFTRKTRPLLKNGDAITPVNFNDFNFRVSYQLEEDMTPSSNTGKNIIDSWTQHKKLFRYINRVRFVHAEHPIFADLSIIKGNSKVVNSRNESIPIPECSIQAAGVFQNIPQYEIELELDNSRIGVGTKYDTEEKIIAMIFKTSRIVLSALQKTNYPISYSEMDDIIESYSKLIHHGAAAGTAASAAAATDRKNFIGPSSLTLQMVNILNIHEKDSSSTIAAPNIRNRYTVTDKADGERRLLFISNEGKIYMIDTNMNVINTGSSTNEKTLFNSVIDGEYIKSDKYGKFIHLYAAFDIYFVNKKNVRNFAFSKSKGEEEVADNKYRLYLLEKSVELIKPETSGGVKPIVIKCKKFYSTEIEDKTIFDGCSVILSNVQNGVYEYNTDGLIFTPCNTAVGGNEDASPNSTPSPLKKITWERSFKWKPPQFNTIDFLVSVKKNKNGVGDEINSIYQNGMNTTGHENIIQYKTLVLRCGYNKKQHGFLNPFQDVLDDKIPSFNKNEDDFGNKLKPVPFIPTNPHDNNACFANILLYLGQNGEHVMKTEEGEYFEEDMIVEFKYDISLKNGWRWIPLRVRYDKTEELLAGIPNYGNAYHVANNNWHSIHNPITEEMISTGKNVPEIDIEGDDVYYNRGAAGKAAAAAAAGYKTNSLRNFHNLYVKKKLIVGVSNINDTLIDYAVGKAGDLSKWIAARLKFVMGVDVSKDNIYMNLDGACARYLNEHLKSKNIPKCIFLNGNSTINIRSGKAFATDKEKMVAAAIFGSGPKDKDMLGKMPYEKYGIAKDGFNVSSCQFAVHYFFESKQTLHSFLRNLSECTAINGYFIGTCYDGKSVFEMLKNKPRNEGMTILKDGKKIYEIIKIYDETGFPDNDTSLGYSINVYQETINKYFREFLVNFNYFVEVIKNYGFVLITQEEAAKMDLPKPSGMFNELFEYMKNEIQRTPSKKNNYGDAIYMSAEEKMISFMNRYFVFKKVNNVMDPKKVVKLFIPNYEKDEEARGFAAEDAKAEPEAEEMGVSESKKELDFIQTVEDKIESIKEKDNESEISAKNVFVKKIKNKKIKLDKFSPVDSS